MRRAWMWLGALWSLAGSLGCQEKSPEKSEPPVGTAAPIPTVSATPRGAVSLPEMGACLSDCRAGDPEADCERVCQERCSAACERTDRPSSFADRCKQDCASEIDRLRSE